MELQRINMNIDSSVISIAALLRKAKFVIPRYQRVYIWRKNEAEEFWRTFIYGKGQNNCIAPVITYEGDHREYYVIEGARDLMTVIFFLSALRDEYVQLKQLAKATQLSNLMERRGLYGSNECLLKVESDETGIFEEIQRSNSGIHEKIRQSTRKDVADMYFMSRKLVADSISGIAEKRDDDRSSIKVAKLDEIGDSLLNLSVGFFVADSLVNAFSFFTALSKRITI
jgi:hypothetical protein